MARGLHRLSARTVATAKAGRHSDGGGLYLVVDPSSARRWAFMFWRDKKPTEIGLGSLMQGVSLPMARERAAECRRLLAEGQSPRGWRQPEKAVTTFAAVAEDVIASLESGWRNDKHRAQWRSTIATYCGSIAAKPVDEITTEDVLKVLQPIWTTKAETASRLRGRIEKVLDAAKAKGLREGENPARWRGHLDNLLAKRQKLQRGHHAAMPWSDLPAFLARLRKREAVAALALEFTILTAARTGEVLGARWDEIDREARIWTVPADRMKAGREHRVPLTDRACQIVGDLSRAPLGEFVFPGARSGRPLSGMAMEMLLRRMDADAFTVHGFRSSFKTWATEMTSFPNELSEAALAHVTGDRVERAYRRTDALERRRELMGAWGRFLEGDAVGNVVPLVRQGPCAGT
ncbi:MAG: tyrosine-type recombinase/integrase [Hyphomicrobiaceae bacterium]